MAECFDELRQLPQAVDAFQTALVTEPNNGEWRYKLGRLYLDMGETRPGDAVLDKAIEHR